MQKKVAILGSTGSIGTQTLDVIIQHPDRFKVSLLTAGNNVDLLIQQAKTFNPDMVIIENKKHYTQLKEALKNTDIEVLAGVEEINGAANMVDADIFLASIVGYAGLKPVVAALKAGKPVALANKETLVVAGSIIMDLSKKYEAPIIPVDSEHSAIFQCLVGETHKSIEKITLTASGGPFLNYSLEQLKHVTPADALKHPNWSMGNKVTIDSGSLMNKGMEVIEAKWLFDLAPEKIDVVVHPQSIIHSMVHFVDGSVKAQIGVPDMRVPILFALGYPERVQSTLPRVNFAKIGQFTFFEPDSERFKSLAIAYEAIKKGGNTPCIVNAANEIAVHAFLDKQIGFLQMTDVVEHALENITYLATPSLELLEKSDLKTREISKQYIYSLSK